MLAFANKMLNAIRDEAELLDSREPLNDGTFATLRRLKGLVDNEIDEYIENNGGNDGK